jgi:hypothetical protein
MPNLDEYLKETIDLCHSLFLDRGNSKPEDSAKYYVIYAFLGYGSTFTALHDKLKEIFNYKGLKGRRDLENGRRNLIESGMLAKILFHHKTKMSKKKEAKIFRGEQYLPANPQLVYDDLSQSHGGKYELLEGYYPLLEELCASWKRNFRGHGFLIEKGILSVYCTAPWLLFSLLNYLLIKKKKKEALCIVTSSTHWCSPPLFSPLVSVLEGGLELKVLLDTTRGTKELDQLKQMEQVEVRNLSKEEVTTNRLTFAGTEYVVDMHKVLGTGGEYSNYIATIYLNMKDIAKQFRDSFEARWKSAI